MFSRRNKRSPTAQAEQEMQNNNGISYDDPVPPPHASTEKNSNLPRHSNDTTPHKGWFKKDGDAGRSGFHPWHFFYCCFRSSCTASKWVNLLWPIVPAAIAVHFIWPHGYSGHSVLVFTLNYIAMVPAANTIGYAGQELGRKLPHTFGVLLETTLGSVVEIILFAVLVTKKQYAVVRAAIIGSILANLLLCLGACFIAGGLLRHDQNFHEVVSETGSGLMAVAGFGLVIPTAWAVATGYSQYVNEEGTNPFPAQENPILKLSRATAILLLLAYASYVFFNMSSHHSIVTDVYESDEMKDNDREKDLAKRKLTLTECIIALTISITCVAIIAVSLVIEIPAIVDHGVSESFMGLILVPVVEKLAEHITAVDEAYDNMPNVALSHVLGASIQTALLNTPIVVIIGWGLGVEMDLDFKQFEAIILILAIFVVGNFLRDGKSNYLEGNLLVIVYVIIAVCAYYYPNPNANDAILEHAQGATGVGGTSGEGEGATATGEMMSATAEAVASATGEAIRRLAARW